MLKKVFKSLDQWVTKTNLEMKIQGLLPIKPFFIKVVGQTALIEMNLDLELFETMDVDAYADYEFSAKQEFERLLKKSGKILDKFSNEIWMPEETEYELIYSGLNLNGYIAKVEYVLISKAIKAPDKNRSIVLEYLSKGPSDLFIKLAGKYKLDLEKI